ncbi:MAG: glycogen debranching protein [Gammaproteobacteria bacterium]|nr:glycogen debranching protein [Gammaproteobacteria bacterium]NIR28470.1 glycogen debranching protein [Gammaproteobacteria bacterium]NIR96916.1 glycogen debranching protein [Gammaproteobacteria bacterium]NIT62617.1 glycogen debranching protein [Gammaproteobacteria bacterium]NIV19574.1 glycogen debranching protein [Gammaproteobacteria bacterium]
MTSDRKAALRSPELFSEGCDRALELLYGCSTPDGFLASPTRSANYRRIWGRDGVIIGLAGLMSGDHDLIECFKRTLQTLARYQGPHGEIPSNVDPVSDRISYGGTTGRVDADLWFVIGCGEYWRATSDDAFLERVLPAVEKARFLLGAWEFNNRGLIYIPQTGDWADEYLHNGYVLYDQLLYLQAQRTLCAIHAHVHGTADHGLTERCGRLRHLIRANYWFYDGDGLPDDVYHEVLYRKGHNAARHCADRHWMSFFSPHGYGYRFDALANVLASLLDVADHAQRERVDRFLSEENVVPESLALLPAFYPVIEPVDEDWEDLHMTFSYSFKNRPYEFHNGGLWPMITGFLVADLARRGEVQRARTHLQAIHRANRLEMDGEPWGFPEFVHGKELTPGGTRHQGWSAAAAVMGHWALEGQPVLRIDDHD